MQIKLIVTRKVVHLASFRKWGFLELGSGLLTSEGNSTCMWKYTNLDESFNSSQTQGRRWGVFPKTCLLSHEKKLMFLGEYFVPCWLLSVAVFKEIKYICGRLGVLTQPNKMYFFSFSTTSPVCSFCWDFYTSRRKTVNSKIFVRTKEYEMNCTFFCWNLIYEVSLASKLLITITVTSYLFSFKFDLNE